MKNSFSIFIAIFFLNLQVMAQAEFACWEMGQIPGFAFESSSVACGNDPSQNKQVGSVSDDVAMNKKIMCAIPSQCVAISPGVLKLFREKLGIEDVKELSKFPSYKLTETFLNTPYMAKYSMLECEGVGDMVKGADGKLMLQNARCPAAVDCGNIQQVLYSMSPVTPAVIPARRMGGSDVKILPAGRVRK